MARTPQGPDDRITPKSAAAAEREARLKAALKANMARRKGQAAARRTTEAADNKKD